jgi:hypothetical protein
MIALKAANEAGMAYCKQTLTKTLTSSSTWILAAGFTAGELAYYSY